MLHDLKWNCVTPQLTMTIISLMHVLSIVDYEYRLLRSVTAPTMTFPEILIIKRLPFYFQICNVCMWFLRPIQEFLT